MVISGTSEDSQGSFLIAKFLQTGLTPNEDEASQIRRLIQTTKASLDETRHNIDNMYNEATAAEKDYIRLRSHINACSSIISLARHIPDDVLREIFCQCLPADGNAVLDVNAAPMVLTQICAHWRRIALTTPALWTTIHVPILLEEVDRLLYRYNFPMTREQSFQRAVGRASSVSQWLERSGVLLLSISLFSEHAYGRERAPPHFVKEYIKAVKPFSSRWKVIRLVGEYNTYKDLLSVSAAEVPCLESLTLALVRGTDDTSTTWLKSGLLQTPSLRKLRIKRFDLDLNQSSIYWNLLTHLTLGSPNGGQSWSPQTGLTAVSRILKQCLSLNQLHLYMDSATARDNSVSDVCAMYLPCLRRLILKEGQSMLALIEKLEAPGLQDITFSSNEAEAETVISRLVAQTNGSVLRLSVEVALLHLHIFQEVLRQTPNLRVLVLKQASSQLPSPSAVLFDDQFLKALTVPTIDGDCLCPHLEEFVCGFRTAFTHAGFLDFIRNKQNNSRNGRAKMKRIHIGPFPESEFIDGGTEPRPLYDEMKPFMDAGLNFHDWEGNNDDSIRNPDRTFSACNGLRPDDEEN